MLEDWPPIPRLWEGETVCLVGSGPSLTPQQIAQVKGRCKILVVNCSYRMAPDADLLYACEKQWWDRYQPVFNGIKVTMDHCVNRPDVFRVPGLKRDGLSMDQWHLHEGGNSGYQALGLAALMGVKKVILLGFDMRTINGKKHHHPDHHNMSNPTDGLFQQWIKNFETTKPDLQKMGVTVLNATPNSAVTAFPLMSLNEALK